MLTLLEYRILKEYSKFPKDYLYPINENDVRLGSDIARRNSDIHQKTKVKMFILDTITNQFTIDKYLYLNGVITPLGQTELHLFWKKWFEKSIESLCKIYLPFIISIIAITLSLVSFFRN